MKKPLFIFLISVFLGTINMYAQEDSTNVASADDLLEMSFEDLLNMEVTTASKSAEKLSDAPGVISVITKDEIERFGGNTLKDLLERVPSLIGSTVYMTDRSTIAPRGDQVMASSSHVLMLINGRPVREILEGGINTEMYESFPVNAIERIEVIRGPGSVLYGSNAISAVINIITIEAEKNGVAVTGLGGLEGGYGGNATATIKAGDLNIMVAGRYLKKADWDTDISYTNVLTPVDTTATFQTKIPNEGIGSYIGVDYKNFHFSASYNTWENFYFVSDYATLIPFPTYGTNNWTKTFGNLGYTLNVTDKWDMDFNVTYNQSTFKTEAWPSTNRDSYEMVAEWNNSFNPTEKLGIVFGGLYNHMEGQEWGPSGDVEKFMFTDAKRYSIGAYGQINYKIIKGLNTIAGVQANKVEGIDFNAVPRIGLIWYPVERVNVKALYSQAFRAPSLNELTINFPQMMGNPNLIPEKVSSIDLGVNYQGEQLQGGINAFYSKQQDIIFQNRDLTVVPGAMYTNGLEVEIMGLELEGKYYINKSLFLTGSMLYQKNENKAGEENITPIPNLGVKAGVSYVHEKGISLGLFNVYQGDFDDKFNTRVNPNPEAYNLMSLYGNANINKLFSLDMKSSFSVFTKVDNLLDTELWLPDWGLTLGKTIPVNQGRAIYFGVKATL